MKNKIEPSHQPFAATNTGALSSTEADRAEHEPDYSGGAIRLAIPTQTGTTIRVGRGGHSVTHIPPALASKRTLGPAHRWRQREADPSGKLESGSRFPRKHHQKTCRLGRGSLPGEHLPRAPVSKRNRSGD